MVDLIRGSSMLGYAEVVRDLGGDPAALLRRAGLDPPAVGDHDRFIPYTAVARAMNAAAVSLGRPDFGILVAGRQDIGMLGPIAVIMRNSATFGEAVDGACQFLHTYGPAIRAALVRGSTPRLTFTINVRRVVARDLMLEFSLGACLVVMKFFLGEDFVPHRVTFTHAQRAPRVAYEALFGTGVEFEATQDAVYLPRQAIDQPVTGSDARARAIVAEYLAPIHAEIAVADHVHALTHRLMPLGGATLTGVARSLSLHPRALQRELSAAGTTFEDILDQARREEAWSLARSGMSAGQVATTLGYAEQSSYTRACRRWFGCTPKELAARRRANPDELVTSAGQPE